MYIAPLPTPVTRASATSSTRAYKIFSFLFPSLHDVRPLILAHLYLRLQSFRLHLLQLWCVLGVRNRVRKHLWHLFIFFRCSLFVVRENKSKIRFECNSTRMWLLIRTTTTTTTYLGYPKHIKCCTQHAPWPNPSQRTHTPSTAQPLNESTLNRRWARASICLPYLLWWEV